MSQGAGAPLAGMRPRRMIPSADTTWLASSAVLEEAEAQMAEA